MPHVHRRLWPIAGAILIAIAGCSSGSTSSDSSTAPETSSAGASPSAAGPSSPSEPPATRTSAGEPSGNGTTVGGPAGSGSATASSAGTPPSQSAVTGATAPRDLVPAAIRSAGVIQVASTTTNPPAQFLDQDGKTVIGYWPDILSAMGEVLDLRIEVNPVAFASLITGIQGKRYDVGTNLVDNAEREKVVDFVDVYQSSNVYIVRSDTTATSACGLTVGVPGGSQAAMVLPTLSDDCTAAGDKAITPETFSDYDAANLALSSGRVDAVLNTGDAGGYQVLQSKGKLKLMSDPFNAQPLGIIVAKDSGLQPALLAAGQAILANGTYQQILQKWGVPVPSAVNMGINLATS